MRATSSESVTALPDLIRGNVLEDVMGFTLDAQKKKRSRGEWLEGRHYHRCPDGKFVYNWRAIQEWCRGRS